MCRSWLPYYKVIRAVVVEVVVEFWGWGAY